MSLLDDEPKPIFNWAFYVGLLIFIILASSASWYAITKPKLDKATLCELDTISNTTVILFDKTGGFSINQQRLISKAISAEVNKLSIGDRLTIYEVDDEEYMGLSKPTFDSCRPKNSSEINELYENKHMVTSSFDTLFLGKLKTITAALDVSSVAKNSPIIESLYDISTLYHLNKDLDFKKLIIVSDLLQHSDKISSYTKNINSINQEKLTLIPDLFGAKLQVYWLQRSNREQEIQNSGLLQWWEKFFEISGVIDFSIMKVR